MKNWVAPMMLLSLSGLGLVCASDWGREGLRTFLERLGSGESPIADLNKFVEEQLTVIQDTLDRLAVALEESQT